jgi:RNA polymerase sigma factor (sigma-70 family)
LRRASDERLTALARAGDQRAFEVIIDRYRPLLLAHCRTIVGDAAQDALQQALMSAWCALLRGPEVRDLRAWLFTIAHRAALQLLRDEGAPVDQLPALLAGGRTPEEQIELSARARATLAAVAGLPSRERDALVWTSIHGRSGRDTAHALGVSEEAVRQLIFRARAHARAAFGAFVPAVLGTRLPALAGNGARRLIAVAQRSFANAGSMEANNALVRLAPALAAGALVVAPVVAVELGRHPSRQAPAPITSAVPSGGVRALGNHPRGPAQVLVHAPRPTSGLRTSRARAGGLAAAGGPAQRGSNPSLSAGAAQHSAPPASGERQAGLPFPGAATAPTTATAGPGEALKPVRASGRRGVAAAREALAPTAASTQGAVGSVTSGAKGLAHQALEPAEAPAAIAAQPLSPGLSAPAGVPLP